MALTRSTPNNIFTSVGNGLALFLHDADGTLYLKDVNGNIDLFSNYVSGGGSTSLQIGITAITDGTVGRLLFEGAGNILQEDSNLNWDNTNKTLGLGATATSTSRIYVVGKGSTNSTFGLNVVNSALSPVLITSDSGSAGFGVTTTTTERVLIKGLGATISTNAFKVQNSTPTDIFTISDNGNSAFAVAPSATERLLIKGIGTTNTTSGLKITNSANQVYWQAFDNGDVYHTVPNVNSTAQYQFARINLAAGFTFGTNSDGFSSINALDGNNGKLFIGRTNDSGIKIQPHQTGTTGAKTELTDNFAASINGEKLFLAVGVGSNYVTSGLPAGGEAIWTRWVGSFQGASANEIGILLDFAPTIVANVERFSLLDYNPTITSSTGVMVGLRLRPFTQNGFGLGATVPTAQIHISAGTATENTAPIKLTAGVVLTTPEAGTIEFTNAENGLTFTAVATRRAFLLDTATQTITNKRITKRSTQVASDANPTINTDNLDFYELTAQAVDVTSFTANLSGTPTVGQTLWIAITGTGSHAITWGASFEASTIALPTTLTTTRQDIGFVWNSATNKFRCIAVA